MAHNMAWQFVKDFGKLALAFIFFLWSYDFTVNKHGMLVSRAPSVDKRNNQEQVLEFRKYFRD